MSTSPEIVEEITAKVRFYPKLNSIPRNRRTPRAIRLLKEWTCRTLKVEQENILIAQEVNEAMWKRGIQKPPRYIYITAQKASDDVVEIILAHKEIIESRPAIPLPAPDLPLADLPLESDKEDIDEEEEDA